MGLEDLFLELLLGGKLKSYGISVSCHALGVIETLQTYMACV